jgi:kinesin family protein 1
MCYVNGKQVDVHTNIELTSGSRVIFGKSHVFRFLNPEQARRKSTKIESASGMLNLRLNFQVYLFENLEPTDWNSAIQELLEKQGVDIKSEMEKKSED